MSVLLRATNGPLTIHSENPRYFADSVGRPVYLTGSHTWATIQEAGTEDPPEAFDWSGWLDFLTEQGHSFTRLWMWENPKWGSWWLGDYFIEPIPWARTGPGDARDGKPRFDLEKFDGEFFERLRGRVADAQARGLYVSVMLFQGWSSSDKPMLPQESGPNPWYSHPFNGNNNVNGINAGSPDGEGRDWVHTLRFPEVTSLLEAYIRHTIDIVNDFDNVIYEVANECDGSPENTAWQYHVVNFVHEYERAEKPAQHPVLITAQYPYPDNTALFVSPAEAVSPMGWGKEGDVSWQTDPPVTDRIVLLDPDHIWGVGGTADWVWKSFARGHNPLYMDPWGYGHMEPRFVPDGLPDVRKALGVTRQLADVIDLARTTPQPELASTRFVLADPGREYVVYQPDPGRFGLDLTSCPGTYRLQWWDPTSGPMSEEAQIEGGEPIRLAGSDDGPSVAHVRLTA